jgi:SAM-dependent methyltransferase
MRKLLYKIQKCFDHKFEDILLWGILISIFIILTDALDGCSFLLNRIGAAAFVALVLLASCVILLYTRLWRWMLLPVDTELDRAARSGVLAGGMLFGYTMLLYLTEDEQFHIYKIFLTLILLLLLAGYLFFRYRMLAGVEEEKEKSHNTYTLRELYQGEIHHEGDIVYLEEEAVDYDLLNRGDLICAISEVIRTCQPRGKYVISLSGEWGQGKTTVINNVKRELRSEENITIIDDFDPWNYESGEALFSGMMDAIFQYAEIPYDINRIRRWKKQLGELIFNINAYTKGFKLLLNREQEQKTVQEIKVLMNGFLGRDNRKIVFVLDNIERMDEKNILLLFKLVADVLDLEHIIYLLSFDVEQIGTVLKNAGLKDNYLKKVIQMEFYVPLIDQETKRKVFEDCLKNLLVLYRTEKKIQEELLHLSDSFMSKIVDVRDMKRFFNSIISACYGVRNSLDQQERWIRRLHAKDYVIMELLKRENPLLYQEIAKNANFFVSFDRGVLFGWEMGGAEWKKKFSEEAKIYFNSLFSNLANKEWGALLAEIFPYLENYRQNREVAELVLYGGYSKHHKKVIQDARICSGKFFYQYFTLQSNHYMKIKLALEEVVSLAGHGKEELCRHRFEALCSCYQGPDQTEILEMLDLLSEDLGEAEWNVLFRILYEMSEKLCDYIRSFRVSARKRSCYLLSQGMDRISQSLFDIFLEDIQGQYHRFWTWREMLFHKRLNPNSEDAPPRYEGRASAMYDVLRQMAESIDKDGINLYSDIYYREENIWGWYDIVRHMPDIDIKSTFSEMLDEESIYRFLWDMTQRTVGKGFGYTLRERYFSIFTDRDSIAAILESRTPQTESESFVRQIWDAYLNWKNNDSKDDVAYEITREYGVELKL